MKEKSKNTINHQPSLLFRFTGWFCVWREFSKGRERFWFFGTYIYPWQKLSNKVQCTLDIVTAWIVETLALVSSHEWPICTLT